MVYCYVFHEGFFCQKTFVRRSLTLFSEYLERTLIRLGRWLFTDGCILWATHDQLASCLCLSLLILGQPKPPAITAAFSASIPVASQLVSVPAATASSPLVLQLGFLAISHAAAIIMTTVRQFPSRQGVLQFISLLKV